MKKSLNNLGCSVASEKFIVFFGNTAATIEKIKDEFPNLHLKKIRQTHSDIITEASDTLNEADSHMSKNKNEALLIATADCMPIMIYCQQTHRAAAVHAGWRGIENKITEKTLDRLIKTGSTQKDFLFFVGPHILKRSFEVSADVAELLEKSQYNLKKEDYITARDDKFLIDLNLILLSQIKNSLQKEPVVEFFNIDTKTDSDYHSFRRDSKTTARNLSFISVL